MAIRFPSALDSMVVNIQEPTELVVNKTVDVVANKARSKDRHNKDNRREYMRKYMAEKRDTNSTGD